MGPSAVAPWMHLLGSYKLPLLRKVHVDAIVWVSFRVCWGGLRTPHHSGALNFPPHLFPTTLQRMWSPASSLSARNGTHTPTQWASVTMKGAASVLLKGKTTAKGHGHFKPFIKVNHALQRH